MSILSVKFVRMGTCVCTSLPTSGVHAGHLPGRRCTDNLHCEHLSSMSIAD